MINMDKMSVKEEHICRMCFNITEHDFEIIDESTRKMFDVILLKTNLGITDDPIICRNCAHTTKKTYYFKLACMDTEKLIISTFGDKKGTQFELTDIYRDDGHSKYVEDCSICRLCLNPCEIGNCFSVEDLKNEPMFAEMIPAFMPEVDFHITKDPVICLPCRENLESYFHFLANCSNKNEEIKAYCRGKGNTTKNEVTSLKNGFKHPDEAHTGIIKKEHTFEEGRSVPVNLLPVEAVVIKKEDVDLNENSSIVSLDIKDKYNAERIVPKDTITYKCEMCTYETKYKRSLKNHKLTHKEPGNVYKCTLCTYEAKQKGQLSAHMRKHKRATESTVYTCPICPFKTKYQQSIKPHLLTHKDISEIETYKCTTCSFVTKYKSCIKKHTLIHSASKEVYSCDQCPYATKCKGSLTYHRLSHRNDLETETYKCATCPYETSQENELTQHVLTHENVQAYKDKSEMGPYKCAICDYETKLKRDLRNHILNHNDGSIAELHKCTMCPFETKYKRYLSYHVLIHKDTSEVQMYKCADCSYETRYKRYLKDHVVIHKDRSQIQMLKCTVCRYETRYKKSLKDHMLMHKDRSEVEMFKCPLCSYETKFIRGLKKHSLIHKDVLEARMYKCEICTYNTTQQVDFESHILTHEEASQ